MDANGWVVSVCDAKKLKSKYQFFENQKNIPDVLKQIQVFNESKEEKKVLLFLIYNLGTKKH